MILRIQQLEPQRKDEVSGDVLFQIVAVGVANQKELSEIFERTTAGYFTATVDFDEAVDLPVTVKKKKE